jgi:hypothetical protein
MYLRQHSVHELEETAQTHQSRISSRNPPGGSRRRRSKRRNAVTARCLEARPNTLPQALQAAIAFVTVHRVAVDRYEKRNKAGGGQTLDFLRQLPAIGDQGGAYAGGANSGDEPNNRRVKERLLAVTVHGQFKHKLATGLA